MKLMKIVCLLTLGLFSNHIYSQQNQEHQMTNQAVVEKFLNGFNDPSQIQASLDLLAEDYKFKNPMVELNSKAEFIGLAKEISTVLTGVKLMGIAENGNWVATYYEFSSTVPGVESNIASEWFKLEDGIIKESHLIYDASIWRKIYTQMEK